MKLGYRQRVEQYIEDFGRDWVLQSCNLHVFKLQCDRDRKLIMKAMRHCFKFDPKVREAVLRERDRLLAEEEAKP